MALTSIISQTIDMTFLFNFDVFIKLKLYIFKNSHNYLFDQSLSIDGPGMVFWLN